MGRNDPSVAEAMRAALEHHRAGRLPQAESLYRQILRLAPDHADAWYHLGVIAHQMGRSESAVDLIGKAVSARPSEPIYYSALGLALENQGMLNEAVASYRKALSLKPEFVEAHYNLGGALLRQGRLDEAVASYRQALSFRPDYAEAHNNLGLALLEQGKPDEAIASYRRVLSLRPDHAEAHNNLGTVLKAQGKLDEAFASYQRALSFRPDFAEAHYNLGNALLHQGKAEEALARYRQTLSFRPDFAEAHFNMGNVLLRQGKLEEAVASYQQALSHKPGHAEAYNNLGNAFRDQGMLDAAVACYRQALSLKQDLAEAHSNLLFAIQYYPIDSPDKLMVEYQGFAARFETPLKTGWQRHRNARDPIRRLKVGYVSPDFRGHATAYFIEPVLASHDKDRFEIFCYYSHAQHDEFTERLAGYADRWLDCKTMTDEELAGRVLSDRIDILVDLAGHTAGNRLLTFARKPAPIQIGYLGYPGTSGLAAMDYRLTDAYADPPGNEVFHTETLLRLPDCWYCYRPWEDMPEIAALPAQQNGYITFGSFNNFNKINRPCTELWAQLLRAVPDSRLLMVTVPEGRARQGLAEQFAALGVRAERLEFHGRLARGEFLRMFHRADIALDPFPVTGGTTTCETLWMGVPVISLVGTRCISRMAFSVLSAVGLRDLAAATPEAYISTAVNLAQNLPRLAALHAGLRGEVARSPLTDETKFTRNLERIYREVWTDWCNTTPP